MHESEYDKRIGEKTWLEKPFPYSYNLWIDGLVKEINPRFYVDADDNVSYIEDRVDRNQMKLNEHGADDSWSDNGDTVTLQDILELTKDITIINYPTKELAPKVLGWEDNPEEIERISQVEVSRQYPILIMVNEYNEVQWILDGNHRTQQALMNGIETIPAKLIKPSDLDGRSIKIFYPDGIPEPKEDYFTGSKFGDDEGNEFDVESIYEYVKSNGDKYLKKNISIDGKLKHNFKWWEDKYDINNPEHKERMMNSDTSFPILVVIEKDGNWAVSDGLNRLYKAKHVEGKDTIDGYVISKEEILDQHIGQLNEQKESKLNPELMVGDEILVVDNSGTPRVNLPELYRPYVVEFVHKPNKYQPNDAQSYYTLDLLDPPDLETAVAQGIRIKDLKLYPQHRWIFNPGFKREETITEPKESGLNPELEIGDTILIIDIDRERENGETQYTTPSPELRPERYVPYEVVEKKSSGGKSKWPFNYVLVPEGEIEITGRNPQGEKNTNVKLLYPWIYQWIYADTPTATNVDRKTLSEQQDKVNSELEEGDIIRVIEVKDEGRPNKPDRGGVYKVVDKGMPPIVLANESVAPWYQIVPHPAEDLPNTNYMTHLVANYGDPRAKRIYWGDTWVKVEKKKKGLNPELMIGDEILVLDANNPSGASFNPPKLYTPYVVIGIKHRQPENSESPDVDTRYYELERIDITDEERLGELIAGGGRRRLTHLYTNDTWRLRPGFLRGELNEHNQPELSPDLDKGDIIRVIEIDGEHANMPDIWGIYKVHDVKQDNVTQEFYYELSGETSEVVQDSIRTTRMFKPSSTTRLTNTKYLYYGDTWIPVDVPMASNVDRKTLSEHKKYSIDKSNIEGEGVFATHDIEKGEFIGIPIPDENKFAEFVRTRNDKLDTRSNLAKKLNHQSENNCIVKSENNNLNMYAQNDIKKGDEITIDYKNSPWYINKEITGFKENKSKLNEHQEELNQPLTMGDVIRVVDVDKDSEYEQPTYPYDTGNASGNSLMTNHHRGQIHGQDTYPRPMVLYAVMSKSLYRTKDRDYLNPYWMLWPVDDDGKVLPVKDFHEIILTEKDTWITIKKHISNIPGDIEAKHKEYVDSGRDIMSRRIREALNDLVYRDEPHKRHKKRMSRDLGTLNGFPIHKFKNMPPPENESDTTEEEIDYLDNIPVDNTFIESADEIDQHFKSFLNAKGLEYPEEELKRIINGVRGIILILKYHYNRPRPWQIAQAKGLKLDAENLKSASTPSYPSGHAAQGRFIGRYLADLYPEYGQELIKIGDDIAYSRNMAKVHYPSDSEFGKLIGDEMYEYVHQPELELSEARIHIVDGSHPYSEQQYSEFVDFVVNELGIQNPPPIRVEVEPTSTYTTGYYNNKKEIVKVRGHQRQLADILRSIAHELVHHKQKEDGLIQKPHPQIGGPIEDEANSMSGRLVKTYGKMFPEIYSLLQEQYEKPEDRKKGELTTHLFNILDDNFGIYPHPEGELNYEGNNMQLYSYDHKAFVPVEALYHDIPKMLEGGIPEEDATLFINILTDWVNNRITFKEPQLNEQTEEKTYRMREMVDTDNYKIVVPLDPESFCSLVPKAICAEPISEGRWDYLIGEGTPYFLLLKKTNERFIVQDRGKVPFLRDEKSNYTFYRILDKTLDWSTQYDMKKLLSDKPELIEFFNIEYSKSDLIKFDMIQSEEDIRKLVVGEFARQIFKIMNSNMHPKDIEEILWDFAGEGVGIETGDVSTWNSFRANDNLNVYVNDDGVSLQMREEIYHDKVVSLHDDDEFYYKQAKGLHYEDPFEEIEDTEIDYIAGNFTQDTLDKWNEVMVLLGENEYTKDTNRDFDEGDITDPMNAHGGDEWYDVAGEITSELGYGIGEERAKELKSHLDSEMLFEDEYYNSGVVVDLTWTQLLWVINYSEARTFEELMQESWNSIEAGLSDIWYDGYGYSDEIGEAVNTIMNDYLTRLLDNPDGLKNKRENLDNLIKILKDLKFGNPNPTDMVNRQTIWVDKEQKKQVQIMNFDNAENMIDIKVAQEVDVKGGKENRYQDYRIKPEQLSDYVLSNDLVFDEKQKTMYGTWGIKYL